MGLFYPNLLVPELFPQPPRTWSESILSYNPFFCWEMLILYIVFRFQDHENMLEETWNMDFGGGGGNMGLPVWDSFAVSPLNPKKEEKIGLAEAITSSILSAGKWFTVCPVWYRKVMTPNKIPFLACRTHRPSAKTILQHTVGRFLKTCLFL